MNGGQQGANLTKPGVAFICSGCLPPQKPARPPFAKSIPVTKDDNFDVRPMDPKGDIMIVNHDAETLEEAGLEFKPAFDGSVNRSGGGA